MKRLLTTGLLFGIFGLEHVAQAGFGLTLSPIVGYERIQKLLPTPRTRSRLVYGARATLGIPLLALEAQYTRGDDTEEFSSGTIKSRDLTDKAKVGLRSSLGAGPLRFVARGGVQAKQNHYFLTVNGVEMVNDVEPIVYKPYAGAGLDIRLSSKIAFTADVTTIFTDWPNMNKNEYETTAGFTIRLP